MYNPQELSKRIKETANKRNIVLGAMWKDLGISNNTLHNMKTSVQKADTIYNIAEYLGVSLDYLFGRTDIPDIENDNDAQLFNLLKGLSDVDKADFIVAIKQKLSAP